MKFILILTLLLSHKVQADGDYNKHEATLLQFYSKIHTLEKSTIELLKEKNSVTDSDKSKEIIETIKKNLKERKENVVRYNKEFHHIRYEHPEKSGQFTTKYKRFDDKKIKEFEDEVNKLLSNVYKNVKEKYDEK